MKQNLTHRVVCSIGVALLLTLSLTQCNLTKKNCCGYKGPIVSKEAIALYTKEHFIPKATIDEWTQRFKAFKNAQNADSSKSLINELSTSYSYNGYYVNLILCNYASIGLRVLPGLDEHFKMHFIIVGINPDYTNLYIRRPGSYSLSPKAKSAIWGTDFVEDEPAAEDESVWGGLQFSQRP